MRIATATVTCPVCGLVLDQGAECDAGHRWATEVFLQTLRNSIQALQEKATRLRQVALRLDRCGDTTAKEIHEQACEAELRAHQIALLLERQPRWPETPIDG